MGFPTHNDPAGEGSQQVFGKNWKVVILYSYIGIFKILDLLIYSKNFRMKPKISHWKFINVKFFE